jgi:hypothetical protein
MTDECNEDVLIAGVAASGLFDYNKSTSTSDIDTGTDLFTELPLSLHSFPGGTSFDESDNDRLEALVAGVDCIVAIERAGPSSDGTYRTMRCRDMTHIVAPLDRAITAFGENAVSIGIGDGGNEVGMGKVYDSVISSKLIPNAPTIACVVATDLLLVSSVSNWGGYALAAAAAVVQAAATGQPVSELLHKCLPSHEQELSMCRALVDAGARDGVSAQAALSVDGMPLQKSLDILNEIREISLAATSE